MLLEQDVARVFALRANPVSTGSSSEYRAAVGREQAELHDDLAVSIVT